MIILLLNNFFFCYLLKSVKFLLDIYQYIVQINDVRSSDSDNTGCLPALEGRVNDLLYFLREQKT